MTLRFLTLLSWALCAPWVIGDAWSQAAEDDGTIQYRLVAEGGFQTWSGELGFAGNADGVSEIRLPGDWGPETGLEAQFSDLQISVDGAAFDPVAARDGVISVEHPAHARLTLRYRFSQDYEGLPQWGVQRVPGLRPVTQPGFAVFVGAAAFPHPVRPEAGRQVFAITVTRDGEAVPVRSSLGDGADIRTEAIPVSRFLDTLWVVGAFETESRDLNGVTIRSAIRGDLPFPAEAIQNRAERMIADATALFRDTPFDTYLIAAMPLPPLPEQSAVIGTAFHQTFLILTTANAPAEEVRHTMSHEVLHEWITGRMGPTDMATDPARMWFTEGFTEYFTLLVRLRVGDLDLEGFLAAINALEARYEASPVRDMTRQALIDHVWDSRDTERLPYQRGALLAFRADGDLASRRSGRLADILAGLIDENQAHREQTGQSLALTDARIQAALEAGLGEAGWRTIDRVTGEGVLLTDPDRALFGCLVRAAEDRRWQVMDGVERSTCRDRIAG
ncbi:M61 family metallopeptidase [Maricaulis alexandrii]|uniref:M61 family metallopeptidase n=1 Tax=Maricaulis alexandrii TaxID=2570354 RepID=UPI0014861C55|nr:hypothetical protein [Maricaulis alexandrii]